jgi:glycosyltransferase involved in cell wall biosynthesis
MKISVAIGAYEMGGKGDFFIDRCIKSILSQDHQDVEIVVSDHSVNDAVEKVCLNYNVIYKRNEDKRGSSSANFNNAILHSSGDIIKILCQDDVLFSNNALSLIDDTMSKSDKKWLVSSYYHTTDYTTPINLHHPSVNEFHPMTNLVGTHSSLTIRKDVEELFDDYLIWFMDCEYYNRLYKRWGHPEYLYTPTMMQTLWNGQVTNTLIDNNVVERETKHILQK